MGGLWYLSPSNQFDNEGIGMYGNEGTEMNRLLDEIIPHLKRCDVVWHRSSGQSGLAERARESDRLGAQWYLALHSNAGGNGEAWGPIAFYESRSKELAEHLVQELLATGQKTNRAYHTAPGDELYEVRTPKARACLLEVDFHDSHVGVDFLINRRADAAKAIAKAIVKTDGKEWKEPMDEAASSWATEATERSKSLGIFQGDEDGNYRWHDPISRQETAVVLMRLLDLIQGRE